MPSEAIELLAIRTPAPHEPHRAGALVVLMRLNWFVRLRWVFVVGALALLLLERVSTPNAQRPWPLWAAVLAVAGINVVWGLVFRLLRRGLHDEDRPHAQAVRSGQRFANAQIAVDLLLLSTILHFAGGVENPMAVFYLFHVAISGLLLTGWQALLQSCWALLLYAAVALGEWSGVLPHYAFLPLLGTTGLHRAAGFVLVMLGVVAFGVLGTLYFTLRIAELLDRNDALLHAANTALERSRQALEDLQQRRARFMQTATHQLKNPLAIAQTLANLVRDGIVTDEAGIRATCEKIARRAAEGLAQVTELLTLARVQQADPRQQRASRVDVVQAVTDLCRQFRPLAQPKGIDLTCWTPRDRELHVRLDPQDFRDCIGNLIENAIKYTPGPGRVRVAVTARPSTGSAESVAIHVSDSGMGFDPQLLRAQGGTLGEEPVFDAFRRGPNALAAGIPGTGLGLTIVREVVEQAGGRIWLVTRPGAGSSFTVTLPAAAAPAEPSLARDTRATEVVLELPPDETPGQSGPA